MLSSTSKPCHAGRKNKVVMAAKEMAMAAEGTTMMVVAIPN
jgi:Fe-S oxidoreductase